MSDGIADGGEIYAEARARITDLVRDAAPDRNVPATPAWSVRDMVSHLAGNCVCILEGRLEGVGSDPWTAAQVEDRKDRGLTELLDEWAEKAPQVEAMIPSWPPEPAGRLIADLATHEQDLRGALSVPGARDSRGFRLAFEGFCAMLGGRSAENSLQGLAMKTEDGERVIGPGEASASVAADRFELTRAMAGRRSARQVRAFAWDGDPAPYIEVLTPFALRSVDLVE